MLPTLFLSHGAPTLPLQDIAARGFLQGLGVALERPRAIVAVSAHWETQRPAVNAVGVNDTIHDFHGFPRELYTLRYPAPGLADLAERVADLLTAAGLACDTDRGRGLDHGAWVPLMLMYPLADVPVVQLSVQRGLGAAHHLQVGRALTALRQEGVLVVGSGSFTHNLAELAWDDLDAPAPGWVTEFADWFDAAIAENRTCDLVTYRHRAPHAADNHPTEEHLMPLFVALGAAGQTARPERLHTSSTFGALRMDAYAFH